MFLEFLALKSRPFERFPNENENEFNHSNTDELAEVTQTHDIWIQATEAY